MSLSQILEGEFFTEYIKIGDILMLSRGRNDVDNVFTLRDGQLTMFLDKETYERAGLVGKPYGAKGTRGLRPRWVVEFDLRSPSMFRGKKGFDRLVYASRNVLTEPLTWLFSNVSDKSKLAFPHRHLATGSFDFLIIIVPPSSTYALLTSLSSEPRSSRGLPAGQVRIVSTDHRGHGRRRATAEGRLRTDLW